MTTRLTDVDVNQTAELLKAVLGVVSVSGQRCMFLAPAGSGESVVQRMRVMISRTRKELERRGKSPKRFTLHASYHKETHESKRYDACVLWTSSSDRDKMQQDLQSMLS